MRLRNISGSAVLFLLLAALGTAVPASARSHTVRPVKVVRHKHVHRALRIRTVLPSAVQSVVFVRQAPVAQAPAVNLSQQFSSLAALTAAPAAPAAAPVAAPAQAPAAAAPSPPAPASAPISPKIAPEVA